MSVELIDSGTRLKFVSNFAQSASSSCTLSTTVDDHVMNLDMWKDIYQFVLCANLSTDVPKNIPSIL
jgi:hypothetical protein